MTVVGLDPRTGAIRIVTSGGLLGVPAGMAAEQSGAVVVANGQALLRIDPRTGAQRIIASGGFLKSPIGVTVTADGLIYVVDALRRVNCVESDTGAQTLISTGGFFNRPQAIAVSREDIYVADVAGRTATVGVGRIIGVNARTGLQRVVAEGNYLVGPMAIGIEASGTLLVCDPHALRAQPGGPPESSIVRIDPQTGVQSLAATGTLIINNHSLAVTHQQIWAIFRQRAPQ
jgi:hypothetical protein